MQQQPEKEGEPAAWFLVLWLMRWLKGLPQIAGCLQGVTQGLGAGQSATKGEKKSLRVPRQSSVKSSSGNAVRSGRDGSEFTDFEASRVHHKIMLYILISFSRRYGWTVPTFCAMLIFDLQFLGHIYLAAERSAHT